MMEVRELSSEVLFAKGGMLKVARNDIELLKRRATHNERRRIRVCAHEQLDDAVHEMLIVFGKGAYIRPHRHVNKVESFHVIEGRVDVVILDDLGNISDVTRMGGLRSGRILYYRSSKSDFHTLLIGSEFVVLHETTNGPLRTSDTLFAPWAPEEGDSAGQREYMERLVDAAENFLDGR